MTQPIQLDGIAMGAPPSLWITGVILWLGVCLTTSSQFVLTSALSIEVFAGREDNVRIILACDLMGGILCIFIASIVDNYKLHHRVTVVGLLLCSVVPAIAAILLPVSANASLVPLLMLSVVAQLFGPLFIAFSMLQLSDRIGTSTSLYFTCLLTASYSAAGLIQLAVFWGRSFRATALILTMVCILVFFALFTLLTYLPKDRFFDGGYEPGRTRIIIETVFRAIQLAPNASKMDLFEKNRDQAITIDSKKTAKILLVLLTLAVNLSIQQDFSRLWASQYWFLAHTGLFMAIDFNGLWLLMTAVLILLIQFVAVPLLKGRKLPVSVFSLGISAGYLCCCLAGFATMTVQEYIVDPRLTESTSWLLLVNSQDTSTYVRAEGRPAVAISAGSVELFEMEELEKNSTIFATFNFFYETSKFLDLAHELGKASFYVLTSSGDAYQLPVENCVQSVVPVIIFVCPTDLQTGDFYFWCNITVTMRSTTSDYFQRFELLDMGNGSSIELPTDQRMSVDVYFHGEFYHDDHTIHFHPLPGGKYMFILWRGDVDLRVRYRIMMAHPPYPLNSNFGLIQILCRALAVSFTQVPLQTVIHINAPTPVVGTLWSAYSLSSKFLAPIFIILGHFKIEETSSQLYFTCLNLFCFFIFLVALRIAKYK